MSKLIPFADPLNDIDLYWIGYISADGSMTPDNRPCARRTYMLNFFQRLEALRQQGRCQRREKFYPGHNVGW